MDTYPCLVTLSVVTSGVGVRWERCYWHSVGRGQGYYQTSYSAQGGRLQQRITWPRRSAVLRLRNHVPELLLVAEKTEEAMHTLVSCFWSPHPSLPEHSSREELEGRSVPVPRLALWLTVTPWPQSPSGCLSIYSQFTTDGKLPLLHPPPSRPFY